jgi:hypothetical protein
MAIKLGLIGPPNTGKSYSRKFIDKGEDVFVLAPSAKMRHITDSDNKPLKKLDIKYGKYANVEELRIALKVETVHQLIPTFLEKKPEELEITGNWAMCKLDSVENYLQFVDKFMPHIKTIIIPDFTHFISAILANKKFISRKQGGEAFQRFWELAGDVLEKLMISIDDMREDLIVVTEYHCEYNEIADTWEIFVPGGKMLQEKFKLDSYYDFMLYTHVSKKEDGEVEAHNFVTKKWGKYNARAAELFETTLIPNNLQTVLEKMREYNGI